MSNTKFVKAPYNFIPLNKEVVYPHWGAHISHDIPFSDSQSGKIRVSVEAHSPVFVMDGTKEKDNDKSVGKFAQFEGKHFLPGSSLKGMIRSVLEVMTFSKMANKVQDSRYAVRDLSGSLKNLYLSNFKPDKIYAGWLQKMDDKDYVIHDCGHPGRISHRHLDAKFGTDFSKFFLKRDKNSREKRFNPSNDTEKAAKFKYEQFEKVQPNRKHRFQFVMNDANREIYELGDKESGTIVFTGQPGPRMKKNGKWTGHHLEFIFFESQNVLPVDFQIIENFFFAYYDHDTNQQSIDWKRWKKKLDDGEKIPVFFQKEGSRVKHLGLSYLYKLPYDNSIRQAINHHQKPTNELDLSEAIFGYVNEDNKDALKGRVHIGHAFATHSEEDQQVSAVLSSPKASYFPNYIRQNGNGGKLRGQYATLMDRQPEIAGWKRYPVHRNGVTQNAVPDKSKNPDKISTRFVPLKAGARFEFDIHYHNLKTIELGALLSALTFHQTENTYHSIGMAKPLGYGKISVSLPDFPNDTLERNLNTFEAYMTANLKNAWHQSPQIEELLTMVSDQDNQGSSELSYMKLGMRRGENHFVEAKRNKEILAPYSELTGVQKRKINSLIAEEDVATMRQQIAKEVAAFKSQRPMTELLEDYKNEQQAVLYRALEGRKEQLRNQLLQKRAAIKATEADKLAAIEEAQKETIRAERQKVAEEQGFDFASVDCEHKRAFDQLKKDLKIYLERLHRVNNYDRLDKNSAEGLLPSEQHEALKTCILKMIAAANNKEQKKWKKQPIGKNPNFKKIAEWVGKEKAEAWLGEMK